MLCIDCVVCIVGSVYEWWVLCNYHAVNHVESLYTCACGVTWDIENLNKMCEYGFIDQMFHSAEVLQRLKLTPTEIALLKGIIVLSTGIIST